MKYIALRVVTACALLGITSCVYDLGYGGGYPYPGRPTPPPGGNFGSNYYQRGYNAGTSDARAGRSNYAERHLSSVPGPHRRDFVRGYDAGYRSRPHQGSGWPGWGGSQQDASYYYGEGKNQGRSDRMRGRRYDPSRYLGNIPRHHQSSYQRGYARGYGR